MPAANPQTTSTRLPPPEEAAIRDLLARLKAAWDSGDAEAFGAVFSEGAKYVTATGRRLDGRAAIVASHARDFRTYIRNTHLGDGYPTAIEYVDDHVALVHGTGAVLFAGESARRHMIAEKKRNIAAWKRIGASQCDTDAARKLDDHAEHGADGGQSAASLPRADGAADR